MTPLRNNCPPADVSTYW